MDVSQEAVTAWLARHQRNREWLAEKCGVSVAAVGHWLNRKGDARPIPARHVLTIQRLMAADAEAASDDPRLPVVFQGHEFDLVESAARIVDTAIKDFVRRAAVHQARKEIEQEGGANGEEGNGRASA